MILVTDSNVKKSHCFGDFLILKIGDKQTKEPFFCEVYLIKRVPAVQQLDTSRTDLPLKLLREHNEYFLLGRTGSDSGRSVIGGIAMKEQADKVVFSIDERANHQYRWTALDSRPLGQTERISVPWEGGMIRSLVITRDYEANWTSGLTYSGPPQVAVGDQ